jgi:hypothetical protein
MKSGRSHAERCVRTAIDCQTDARVNAFKRFNQTVSATSEISDGVWLWPVLASSGCQMIASICDGGLGAA